MSIFLLKKARKEGRTRYAASRCNDKVVNIKQNIKNPRNIIADPPPRCAKEGVQFGLCGWRRGGGERERERD
jgi:hypothetical protein